MIVTIRAFGQTATFDGETWTGDAGRLVPTLNDEIDLLPCSPDIPDHARAIAEWAKDWHGATIIAVESDPDEGDPDAIY